MSHPSWVCGLKQCCTPIAGSDYKSHPSWVCGLKLQNVIANVNFNVSHPSWVCGLKPLICFVGIMLTKVTPFVGVWIETWEPDNQSEFPGSHPSWVCGLKHLALARGCSDEVSHPSWVCGLKRVRTGKCRQGAQSHPSWVCGLKHIFLCLYLIPFCHTLRGCVDWNLDIGLGFGNVNVTPFVGVWIETDLCCRA